MENMQNFTYIDDAVRMIFLMINKIPKREKILENESKLHGEYLIYQVINQLN